MEKMKILVLGASSFVGRYLFKRLGAQNCIGTYNRTPVEGMIHFDALNMGVKEIIPAHSNISHAVILLGDTDPETCFKEKGVSQRLNVDSIKMIIDDLHQMGIRTIFTSSEFVFDGKKGEYTEEDPANPVLLYGMQKLKVEEYLIEKDTPHTILRLAKIYGDENTDGTLFTAWLNALLKNPVQITCATDQRFSPVFVENVVDAIVAAIDKNACGLYHVAGPESKTRIELLRLVVDEIRKYQFFKVKITPCSILDFDLQEKRPVDVSMKPDKLVNNLDIQLMPPARAVENVVKKYFEEII